MHVQWDQDITKIVNVSPFAKAKASLVPYSYFHDVALLLLCVLSEQAAVEEEGMTRSRILSISIIRRLIGREWGYQQQQQ